MSDDVFAHVQPPIDPPKRKRGRPKKVRPDEVAATGATSAAQATGKAPSVPGKPPAEPPPFVKPPPETPPSPPLSTLEKACRAAGVSLHQVQYYEQRGSCCEIKAWPEGHVRRFEVERL